MIEQSSFFRIVLLHLARTVHGQCESDVSAAVQVGALIQDRAASRAIDEDFPMAIMRAPIETGMSSSVAPESSAGVNMDSSVVSESSAGAEMSGFGLLESKASAEMLQSSAKSEMNSSVESGSNASAEILLESEMNSSVHLGSEASAETNSAVESGSTASADMTSSALSRSNASAEMMLGPKASAEMKSSVGLESSASAEVNSLAALALTAGAGVNSSVALESAASNALVGGHSFSIQLQGVPLDAMHRTVALTEGDTAAEQPEKVPRDLGDASKEGASSGVASTTRNHTSPEPLELANVENLLAAANSPLMQGQNVSSVQSLAAVAPASADDEASQGRSISSVQRFPVAPPDDENAEEPQTMGPILPVLLQLVVLGLVFELNREAENPACGPRSILCAVCCAPAGCLTFCLPIDEDKLVGDPVSFRSLAESDAQLNH